MQYETMVNRCISFPKVINPQQDDNEDLEEEGCISFPKVINPQRRLYIVININGLGSYDV